jgi:hypothetical protein
VEPTLQPSLALSEVLEEDGESLGLLSVVLDDDAGAANDLAGNTLLWTVQGRVSYGSVEEEGRRKIKLNDDDDDDKHEGE